MSKASSPTVRRRGLGVVLQPLRSEQELTVEQVAEQLLWSPSKVSRMETGYRGATRRDIRDPCDLYVVTDVVECDHMKDLPSEGTQQGWWQPHAVDAPIKVRITRQRWLTQSPPVQLTTVLDEAVLHRVTGGPVVMWQQLDWLIQAAHLPAAPLQAIEFSSSTLPGVESNFNIPDFIGALPGVVYVEGSRSQKQRKPQTEYCRTNWATTSR